MYLIFEIRRECVAFDAYSHADFSCYQSVLPGKKYCEIILQASDQFIVVCFEVKKDIFYLFVIHDFSSIYLKSYENALNILVLFLQLFSKVHDFD